MSDDAVERAVAALEASFRFGGMPNTRMPGTESVDCREAVRIVLAEIQRHPVPGSLPKLPQAAFNLENDR